MVKFGWDKLKRFLAQANSWTGQQTFSNIAVTGGTISGVTFAENFTSATDPLANAAVSTAIVNTYNGTLVTLTEAGNTQTLQNPTTAATIRKFMVINNDTSNNNLSVVANSFTFVLTPGEGQCFLWDGTAWGPTDLGITEIPVIVSQGGTGASTLTDHSILLGSGTDAVTPLGAATNGQLPIGSTGADPVLATITEGEAIDVTNAAGSITIACEDASTSNKGVVELATNAETATGTSTALAVTPDDLKYRNDSQCANGIEDLSCLPPVTFTWDPGSLDDGVGETSSAITVPGAALGSTAVQCIAPYDLQGITLNAWCDAANSCKARLQNETGGTINLASGTWTLQARRI